MGSAVSTATHLSEEDVEVIAGEMYTGDARAAFHAAADAEGLVTKEAALAYAKTNPELETHLAASEKVRTALKTQSTRQMIRAEASSRELEVATPTSANRRSNLTAFALEDHIQIQFPMYVLAISTLMELDEMRPFEELAAEGKVFEWDPSKGPVFFLSHQWTSFSHPDHTGEQLRTAKEVFAGFMDGKAEECFATSKEWEDWKLKDAIFSRNFNAKLPFAELTASGIAQEARAGNVWLDFACVPQAADAQEDRLAAIESIPHYIDASTTFMVLCPKIKHMEKDEFCDYHSWRCRGWCRLEEQVNELKLFELESSEEWMHGITKWDIPRRPLIVSSATHISTVDVMDHFYTLGLRKNSVLNGEFACCALGHKKTFANGVCVEIPCDKKRLKPFCISLWDRKCDHFKTASPYVQFMYFWRYKSHVWMMQAETFDDTAESTDDPTLQSLDDIKAKYNLTDEGGMFDIYKQLLLMNFGMMKQPMNPDQFCWQGEAGAANLEEFRARIALHTADVEKNGPINMLLTYMVAEGNLKMVKLLVEKHGADLTLGPFFVLLTMIDFCATKGNNRVLEYILKVLGPEKAQIDRLSNITHIAAVDRACKSGYLETFEILLKHGAKVVGVERFNGETCAHSAAMHGHTHILRRLHELGVDMWAETKNNYSGLGGGGMGAGKTALDYATFWNQTDATEYLKSLPRKEVPEIRPAEPTSAEVP